MIGVDVSCNYNFVPGKGSICKLNCYLMSKCRLYLVAAWVRLNEMIVTYPVSLAVHLTGIFELLVCSGQRTVESRHIFLALGLVITTDVIETFLAAATAFRAYRSDRRHYFTSLRSWPISSVTFLCSSRSG